MLSEQQQRILGYFIEEAKDHLNTIEQGLLNLQGTIEDPEMVSEVFRAAHSVKGGAAMLGLNGIQAIAHRLEDYFKVLKECTIHVDQKLESLLLEIFDGLKELLEQLQGPFGLTDDKAAEVMSTVEPVFTAVNEHLGTLVTQSGETPPEDVVLPVSQPMVASAAPRIQTRPPMTEESALQLFFQSDVPSRLRDMLQLFKQADQPEIREQLQGICQALGTAGESFDLLPWAALLELARQAVGNPEQSFRALAPVVIKEIKQAQELVLAGRGSEIVESAGLRSLLPPPKQTEADADFADFFTPDLIAPTPVDTNPDLEIIADVEAAYPASTPDFATSVPEGTFVNDSTLVQEDLFLSEAFDALATPESAPPRMPSINDLGFPENWETGADDPLLLENGPEVGMAELTSLADLFEGEMPDLGTIWQEEEVLSEGSLDLLPEEIDLAGSSEFSDLFFNQDNSDELLLSPDSDDDLSGFFNRIEATSPASLEQPSAAPEPQPESTDPFPVSEEPLFSAASPEFIESPSATEEAIDLAFGDSDMGELGDFFAQLDESELTTPEENQALDAEAADLESLGSLFVLEGEPAVDSLSGVDPTEGIITAFSIDEDSTEAPVPVTDLLPEPSFSPADQPDANALADPSGDVSLMDSLFEDLEEASPESSSGGFSSLFDDLEMPTEESPVSLFDLSEELPSGSSDASDAAEASEPLTWMDALDSEEGLAVLETAPPLWEPDQDDVTSDLWSDEDPQESTPLTALDDFLAEESVVDEDVHSQELADFEQLAVSEADESLDSEFELFTSEQPLFDQPMSAAVATELPAATEDLTDAENWLALEQPFGDLSDFDTLLADTATEPFSETSSLSLEPDEPFRFDDFSEAFSMASPDEADFQLIEFAASEGTEAVEPLFVQEDFDASLADVADERVLDDAQVDGLAIDEISPEVSDLDDLSFLLDDDLSGSRATTNTTGAEPFELLTSDFDDLDALLAEVPDVEPSATSLQDFESDLGDGFDDLEAILAADPQPTPASSPEVDDFADLEELIGESQIPPSAPPLVTSPVEDDFQDLEKLLETADQTFGGTPPNRSGRGTAASPSRRPSRAGVLTDQTMRVSVKNLDNLNNLVGELVVNRNSLEQAEERLRQFLDNLLYQVQQLSDVGQRMRDLYERSLLESSLLSSRRSYQTSGNGGSTSTQSHATGHSFDALEMDRFTGFHTLSQEMIELIVRVRESASDIDFVVEETDQITRNFRQITTQLQEGLTRSRMVPFAQTADRLPRAVRDISLRCGKQAELSIEGRETLIDKMILEQLYDPMTHLVNNAITHGIETPEERAALGKPPLGRITVRTFHQGNQTVISVTDDGAGIDPERVKAKAVERRLITPNQAKQMSRLDVYDLLFHHGFSTRDKADDFAGRGVGMDVVRTSLNEIRGSINIDSTVGRGTTFTIRLPLTLSISKALCCISNRARIAFPMDGVEDMLDVPRDRIQTNADGNTSIQWRDQMLPFQHLSDLLKFNRSLGRGSVYGGNQEDDIISVVILRSNAGNYLALQVDQVLGEQEIVIKQLEGPVPKPIGIAGATVLGDGRIMPIADVLELIDLSMGRIRREAGNALWDKGEDTPTVSVETKTEPTVLIVDDSITVRELLSMTFNKIGYRVEQARDGQEAWEKLRSGLPCDIVFCDIEMPRMDGLELLSRMQKDPHLNTLPIAMLTSRGADRHRQMAIQLGAKGYFTKPYLEEMLLDAAQRMLKGEILISNPPTS